MSVSKWAYRPEVCDGDFCIGDCDICYKPEEMEDEESEQDTKLREWLERIGGEHD